MNALGRCLLSEKWKRIWVPLPPFYSRYLPMKVVTSSKISVVKWHMWHGNSGPMTFKPKFSFNSIFILSPFMQKNRVRRNHCCETYWTGYSRSHLPFPQTPAAGTRGPCDARGFLAILHSKMGSHSFPLPGTCRGNKVIYSRRKTTFQEGKLFESSQSLANSLFVLHWFRFLVFRDSFFLPFLKIMQNIWHLAKAKTM